MSQATNGDFSASSNRVVFFNKQQQHHDNTASIESYQWDISSPQELSLCRKLSDVVHEVESTLTANDMQPEPMSFSEVVGFIHDASNTVKRYMAEYGDFLWNEEQRLEQQLSHASQVCDVSRALQDTKATTAILVNCEYVWSVAEIFWIDAAELNHSIRTTLRFLDVMDKFRTPSSTAMPNQQFDSDAYWRGLYKHAIHGKLDTVSHELKLNANLSAHSKQLLTDVCGTCPLVLCLNCDDDDDDNKHTPALPTKDDIEAWKAHVQRTCAEITEHDKHRLLPLLHILLGHTDVIHAHCDEGHWLDWLCAYLLYHTPWLDHKRELRALVSMHTSKMAAQHRSQRGSIEWMFACIMSREYEAILSYVSTPSFPRWFAPHLCYFLRQIEGDRLSGMQWPRAHDIKLFADGDYNAYLSAHAKMTVTEWIFESYVEHLLLVADDAWIWLKNYLYFFKRRGSAMLASVFEHVTIASDRVAYRMLQCCDELGLDDAVYNMVCLRMAQQAYVRRMQYGRIAYWCCKCRRPIEEEDDDDVDNNKNNNAVSPQSQSYLVCLSKYVRALIERYLDDPSNHINTLHDVYDNAIIAANASGGGGGSGDDDGLFNREIAHNRLLQLLSKLRDMYLCRMDLQKLQIECEQRQQRQQQQQQTRISVHATPYTRTRGHLMEALSKPTDARNQNLKKMADSFEVSRGTATAANKMTTTTNEHDLTTPNYPHLKGRIFGMKSVTQKPDSEQSQSTSTSSSSSSPFPQKIIAPTIKKATNDFLLQHLTTPPRPTPSRHRQSHRKSTRNQKTRSSRQSSRHSSKRKKRKKKKKKKKKNGADDDDSEEVEMADVDDEEWSEEDDDDEKTMMMMSAQDKNYMFECCDIIVSYVEYLVEILSTDIYDVSQLVRILMFSVPMFMHQYSPNAIRLEQVLLITHKWYSVKFMKNRKLSGMQQFDKEHELKFIQQTLSHLQSKVLATTYSNKNYAEIWHKQQQVGMHPHDDDNEEDDGEEKNDMDQDDDDDDSNVIDID